MKSYNDFILTMIAILLGLNLLMPIFNPTRATADGITAVNIVQVDGRSINGRNGLPVHIKGVEK